MTFAFPYIKGIPNVTLSGCVKVDQKQNWERILSGEYRHMYGQYQSRGHDFVQKDAMAVIESHRFWNSPTCSCPLSCNINNITMFTDTEREMRMRGNFDACDEFTPELGHRVTRLSRRIKKEVPLIFLGPFSNLDVLEKEHPPPQPWDWHTDEHIGKAIGALFSAEEPW
jgi:hypothetical protein